MTVLWKDAAFSRNLLLGGVSLIAVSISGIPACFAQAANEDKLGLETVIVTAQHRKENLQAVPISISTISGRTLENTGYKDLTDLQFVVPGVQYDPTQGSAFQIRGVGSTSFDFSNEKSVNVVVDDVVMDAQRDNGLVGLIDVQRVDVLMGPQGTLFGKNSTSGAISVTSRNPVIGDFNVKAAANYGERSDYAVNLIANIPTSANTALRFSVFDQGQDGKGRYVVLNRSLGAIHEFGGRMKFLVQPTDKLEIVAAADYERHIDSSIRTAVSNPANLTALQAKYGVTPGPRNADDADSSFGSIDTPEWGGSLHVNYKIGQDTLTSISAYRGTQYKNSTPADLLPGDVYAYIPYNFGHLDTEKVSQELRWASPSGQFVEYVAGFFYNDLKATQTQLQWATLGSPLVSPTGQPAALFYALTGAAGVNANSSLFQATNTTTAGFGQLKLNLTDRLGVAFGGRYTTDKNSQSLNFITIDPVKIMGRTPIFVGTSAPPAIGSGSVSANNFSYKISPEYKLTNDTLVYASYSTGYKPPGIAFVGNKYDPYKEETVEAFEIGEKSELFDKRLRLNANLFSSKFTDFQATVLTKIPDGLGGTLLTTAIGNAGGLKSEGAELTFAASLSSSWSVNGGVTLARAHFTNYVYNATTNYTGTRLTNAPRAAVFLGADYQTQVLFGLTMDAHIDYSYRSKIWTVVGQPDYSVVPAFGLMNARVGFTPANSNLQFGLYARNLGNRYFSTGWQQYGALGLLHYTSQNAYRTLGGFVKYEY